MRRLGTIITVPLLAAMTTGPVVLAQDESMAMAEHPLVGTWIIADPALDEPPDLLAVNAGGTVVDFGPAGTGYGSWLPTGERSADATALTWTAEAGYAGYSVVRASVEVSEDGQSLSGTYTLEPPTELAEAFGIPAGQLGPGQLSGQRVAVEPMGETVAPIPSPDEVLPAE